MKMSHNSSPVHCALFTSPNGFGRPTFSRVKSDVYVMVTTIKENINSQFSLERNVEEKQVRHFGDPKRFHLNQQLSLPKILHCICRLLFESDHFTPLLVSDSGEMTESDAREMQQKAPVWLWTFLSPVAEGPCVGKTRNKPRHHLKEARQLQTVVNEARRAGKEGCSFLIWLHKHPKHHFEKTIQPKENVTVTGACPSPCPQHFRSPKRLQTWWRIATPTYARTRSSCPSPPPRTLSGRRSSSAPSSDDLLVELYRCRHGVAWLLCLHHTWSYWL